MSDSTEQLNQLFRLHYRMLVGWCRKRLRPGIGDPEDLVHDAYIRCLSSWSAVRRSTHNDASYFIKSVQFVVLDAMRGQRRRVLRETAACRSFALHWPDPGADLTIGELVARLPPRQQAVCRAVLAGKSNDAIAMELDLTRSAIAVHLCRTRKVLRAAMNTPE